MKDLLFFWLACIILVLVFFFTDILHTKYSVKINSIRKYFDTIDKKEIINSILKRVDTTSYHDEDDFIENMMFIFANIIYRKMINDNFKVKFNQVELVVYDKLSDYENYFIEDQFIDFFYNGKDIKKDSRIN